MTLKRRVEEFNPEMISNTAWGGVEGCPNNYPYLIHVNQICTGGACSEEVCVECWSQCFNIPVVVQ